MKAAPRVRERLAQEQKDLLDSQLLRPRAHFVWPKRYASSDLMNYEIPFFIDFNQNASTPQMTAVFGFLNRIQAVLPFRRKLLHALERADHTHHRGTFLGSVPACVKTLSIKTDVRGFSDCKGKG
jgi:hypothetical protein